MNNCTLIAAHASRRADGGDGAGDVRGDAARVPGGGLRGRHSAHPHPAGRARPRRHPGTGEWD